MDHLKVLDAYEVASLMRADIATVEHLTVEGDLPVTKIGATWIYLEDDVYNYLLRRITVETNARRLEHNKAPPLESEPYSTGRARGRKVQSTQVKPFQQFF